MKRIHDHSMIGRRQFLSATAAAAPVALSVPGFCAALPGTRLEPAEMAGKIRREDGAAPVDGATWYVAEADGASLTYRFPEGALAKVKHLSADMLLDGNALAVFVLTLHEGEQGRVFRFSFGGLNQCSFRIRMSLALVDQNRWMVEREGAFLKPACGGDRVDLTKVDRMTLTLRRKGPRQARWCLTPFLATVEEPPRLEKPVLPKGALLDELGQSTLHEWPSKSRKPGEVTRRIRRQFDGASKAAWPEEFSRWGGWKRKKLDEGTGFFRTLKNGGRWWLVDPDGYAFWSAGADCVRVDTDARFDGIETALAWMPPADGEFRQIYRTSERARLSGKFINYLAANLIRAFGPEGWRDRWAAIALSELKRLRFNTVGNWSDWEYARKAVFPYVRPMSFRGTRVPMIYRDMPDVFHPGLEEDAAAYAAQLEVTANDPAFIGYFLMNEPTWGFSSELPAAGMLYNTESCRTREALVQFLKTKYQDGAALSSAWKMEVSPERVARGRWSGVFTPEALNDLRAFSVRMVERYFQTLSKACKKADPNHLNLGMRWAGVPPAWAVEGMKFFDVFSLNCYQEKLPFAQAEKIHQMLAMPVMVGEWHFGALDVGLPASGIGHVKTQADRGRAYRVYLEDAAANPYCVGVHWFTLYDQSALGRYDGENYNIGFLDICNRPYEELGKAAIAAHERMYTLADGREKPFDDAPEYLTKLFL